MARVNVYDSDGNLAGWYDDKKSESFSEDRVWDGRNHVSRATGSKFDHEELIRTAGGRWVLHEWSQWQGPIPTRRFISKEAAREWLLAQGHDGAVEEFFGEIEDERGPEEPKTGPTVNVEFPPETIKRLDTIADVNGISRTELIRRLVNQALVGAQSSKKECLG